VYGLNLLAETPGIAVRITLGGVLDIFEPSGGLFILLTRLKVPYLFNKINTLELFQMSILHE
jgi:hypothetical protein